MAQQTINIGAAPNDGTGDTARVAGGKINANFTELYEAVNTGFVGDYNDLTNKPTLGTAAALDVGTDPLDVVQLDEDGRLPAVDGSLLTGIVGGGGGDVSVSGTPTNGQLAVWVDADTIQGVNTIAHTYLTGLGTAATLNVGTGANQIVQLTAGGILPAVDGSLLTNLPAGDVSLSGTPAEGDFAVFTDVEGEIEGFDMATVAGGDVVRQGFDAIVAGGPSAELTALINTFVDVLNEGGMSLDLAAVSDIWEATSGLLIVTSEVLADAEAEQEITPDGMENIVIDGELGINFYTTVDAAATISAVNNLITGKPYRLRILASGGDRIITPTAADRTVNFGAGVEIPSGKTANFVIILDVNNDIEISFGGYSD